MKMTSIDNKIKNLICICKILELVKQAVDVYSCKEKPLSPINDRILFEIWNYTQNIRFLQIFNYFCIEFVGSFQKSIRWTLSELVCWTTYQSVKVDSTMASLATPTVLHWMFGLHFYMYNIFYAVDKIKWKYRYYK